MCLACANERKRAATRGNERTCEDMLGQHSKRQIKAGNERTRKGDERKLEEMSASARHRMGTSGNERA